MSDITLFCITLVKIIPDFQPSLVEGPSWIKNFLYPISIQSYFGILAVNNNVCNNNINVLGMQTPIVIGIFIFSQCDKNKVNNTLPKCDIFD